MEVVALALGMLLALVGLAWGLHQWAEWDQRAAKPAPPPSQLQPGRHYQLPRPIPRPTALPENPQRHLTPLAILLRQAWDETGQASVAIAARMNVPVHTLYRLLDGHTQDRELLHRFLLAVPETELGRAWVRWCISPRRP